MSLLHAIKLEFSRFAKLQRSIGATKVKPFLASLALLALELGPSPVWRFLWDQSSLESNCGPHSRDIIALHARLHSRLQYLEQKPLSLMIPGCQSGAQLS